MKKIVKGNDFTLRIPVMKMVEGEKVPFPLPSCTDVVVRVTNSFKRTDLEFSIDVAEDNVILARVEGDKLSLGTYAIEVKGKIFGNDWRSNEYPQFLIVNNNADADTEFGSTDEGDNSVEMDTALVILPPSKELESLIEGANNIDIDLNDANLEITRKDGEKKNFDLKTLKGEKGDEGKVQDVLVDGQSVLDGSVVKIDMASQTFSLGDKGQVAGPYRGEEPSEFDRPIFALKDNSEYMYASIGDNLSDDILPLYIYDVTLSRYIEITKNHYVDAFESGDFFNTSEPLDLAHELYLDNDKTGDIATLDQLRIITSDLFVGLPYSCTSDDLDDDNNEGEPQYIYDATSKRWITVLESWYSGGADYFSTAEPLDLSHELKYSNSLEYEHSTASGNYSTALGSNTTASGNYSTALGSNTTASGNYSTALGDNTRASGNYSTALGDNTRASGNYSTALGDSSWARGNYSVALGYNVTANINYSTALGSHSKALGFNSTALGYYATASGDYSTALGYNATASGDYSTALGYYAASPYHEAISIGDVAKANGKNAVAIGFNTEAKLENSTALGYSAVAGGKYAIALGENVSNTKSIFGVGFNGVNGIDMDRDNYGLFLKGFGGYDGTNLVVKEGTTEKLNPNIKSVQEIINGKADAEEVGKSLEQKATLHNGKVSKKELPRKVHAKYVCRKSIRLGATKENGNFVKYFTHAPSIVLDTDTKYIIYLNDNVLEFSKSKKNENKPLHGVSYRQCTIGDDNSIMMPRAVGERSGKILIGLKYAFPIEFNANVYYVQKVENVDGIIHVYLSAEILNNASFDTDSKYLCVRGSKVVAKVNHLDMNLIGDNRDFFFAEKYSDIFKLNWFVRKKVKLRTFDIDLKKHNILDEAVYLYKMKRVNLEQTEAGRIRSCGQWQVKAYFKGKLICTLNFVRQRRKIQKSYYVYKK